MINLFRKGPLSVNAVAQKHDIYTAFNNTHEMPQELKIDLISGNELSIEGKITCAMLNAQKIHQEPKMPQITQKTDQPQNSKRPKHIHIYSILEDFQKMILEEAALLGVKQYLSETQQDLQNKIIKEMDRKRIHIYSLRSEIDVLENNCKKLSEAVPASNSIIERPVHLSLAV